MGTSCSAGGGIVVSLTCTVYLYGTYYSYIKKVMYAYNNVVLLVVSYIYLNVVT